MGVSHRKPWHAVKARDPAVTDDLTLDYGFLSLWINTDSDAVFLCVDPTEGAAQWVELAAAGSVSNHAETHAPNGSDPLATAAAGAIEIGDSAAEGTDNSFARSDHQHSLAAPSAPANVTKSAAAAGTSSSPARADHKHDISTGTPVATGSANAEGTASTVARSDHVHATGEHGDEHDPDGGDPLSTGTPGAIEIGDSAAEGDDNAYARADHRHSLAAPSAPEDVTRAAASAGTSASPARADHKHNIQVGTPVTIGTSNQQGSGTAVALANHVHQISDHGSRHNPSGDDPIASAAPLDIRIGDSATESLLGANSFARSDHIHEFPEPNPPDLVDRAAASAGISLRAARADHKHDVSVGTPGAIEIGDSAAGGSASSLARSDHRHSLAAPSAPENVTKSAASAGSSPRAARADHKHDIDVGSPIPIGVTAATGGSSSLATSTHRHARAVTTHNDDDDTFRTIALSTTAGVHDIIMNEPIDADTTFNFADGSDNMVGEVWFWYVDGGFELTISPPTGRDLALNGRWNDSSTSSANNILFLSFTDIEGNERDDTHIACLRYRTLTMNSNAIFAAELVGGGFGSWPLSFF